MEANELRELHRLKVDIQVADHLLGAANKEFRILLTHVRDIGADKSGLANKNAEAHLTMYSTPEFALR
jgi:hypothetical protein